MPAGRDTDWTHIRVVGDKAAASRYVGFARKLLGHVKQDAAHNGLKTHQIAKRLADGALVVAEIHGAQPIITIVPPAAFPLSKKRMEDRFVTFARREGLWSGIDPDHPEQWLDPPGVARKPEDGWMTRFYSSEVEGFDPDREDHGTYATFGRVNSFPRGTRLAGNIDHRSADGYRISWYGPTSRVAVDAHVNPGVVWLNKVFVHGRVLLEIPLAEAIYGAGYHNGSLFTVEGSATALPVPTTPPSWAGVGMGVTPPVLPAGAGAVLRVCRYPVAASMTPNRRMTLRADAEAREVLLELDWTGKERYPWAFNPDCTEVSGMSTNDNGIGDDSSWYGFGHVYMGWRVSDMSFPADPKTFRYPDASLSEITYLGPEVLFPYGADTRYTVTIERDDAGEYTAEMTSEPATLLAGTASSAVVARDYDEDGNRVDLLVERDTIPASGGVTYDQPGTLFLRLGEQRWPVFEATDAPAPGNPEVTAPIDLRVPVTRRFLLHADLPERTLVLGVRRQWFEFRDEYTQGDTTFLAVFVVFHELRIEIWRRGEQLADVLVGNEEGTQFTGYLDPMWKLLHPYDYKTVPEAMLDRPLAPSFALYGMAMCAESTWGNPDYSSVGDPFRGYFGWAIGANPTFTYSAWPAEYSYGWFGNTAGAYWQTIDYPTLYAPDVDLSERYIPLWCATLGNHTRISGPSYAFELPFEAFTWSDTDQPDTATLTGVGGSYQRFHPLWRLGRFDLIEGPTP